MFNFDGKTFPLTVNEGKTEVEFVMLDYVEFKGESYGIFVTKNAIEKLKDNPELHLKQEVYKLSEFNTDYDGDFTVNMELIEEAPAKLANLLIQAKDQAEEVLRDFIFQKV